MERPYYRIWRPGAGTEFCTDRRNAHDVYELCESYAQIENKIRGILTDSDAQLHQPQRRLHRLLKQCTFEVQQNVYDVLKANAVSVKPQISVSDMQTLAACLRLAEYSAVIVLRSGALTLSPFQEGCFDQWYLKNANVFFNRRDDAPRATVHNCLLAAAAIRILLYAQFGDTPDRIIERTGKKEGSGYYRHSSILQVVPPSWADEACYRFDWNALRGQKNPFIHFPFSRQ